jgi:molecular chaperone GrpE
MSKHKKDKHEEEQNKNIEEEKNSENPSQQKEEQNDQIKDSSDRKIAELEIQVKEWQDKFLRKAAEFENYKRRTETDQFNLINYAAESFIVKLLPIVDDFERSLQHIDKNSNIDAVKEGIKLVYEKFVKVLEDQGIKKMQAKGDQFNVDFHDALMQKKDDTVPPHTVLEEIETGYLYRDKVIRHAKVIVSEESSANESQISDSDSSDSNSEKEN